MQHLCVCCNNDAPSRPDCQLGEFEQDSNTDSELESNTDSHSAQSKAHVAGQSVAERGEEAPHSKEQSTQVHVWASRVHLRALALVTIDASLHSSR